MALLTRHSATWLIKYDHLFIYDLLVLSAVNLMAANMIWGPFQYKDTVFPDIGFNYKDKMVS